MHNDFGQYKAFVKFMGWKIPIHTHTYAIVYTHLSENNIVIVFDTYKGAHIHTMNTAY